MSITNNWISKIVNFCRTHQFWMVLLSCFMLEFLVGAHYNILHSFIVSSSDILLIILFKWLFDKYLRARHYRIRAQWRHITLSIICLLAAIALTALFIRQLHSILMKVQESLFIYPLFKATVIVSVCLIAAQAEFARKTREKSEALSREKALMELRFLRAQINPHFLFNALNNIYALVYIKDPKAPDVILRLAGMLRYLTDECRNDLVSLEKDLDYIKQYIQFQELSRGYSGNVDFSENIDKPGTLIPPMIFQPLIENCFIHSDFASNPKSKISISIELKNQQLCLCTENTKKESDQNNLADQTYTETLPHTKLALENIVQRLKLFYPNAFKLETQQSGLQFHLKLLLDLSKAQKLPSIHTTPASTDTPNTLNHA